MKKLFVSMVFIPFFLISQEFYNTEDYFTRYNPSAFTKKNCYFTGLINLNDLELTDNYFSYLNYKLRIKKLSLGINADYQQFSASKSIRGGLQVAYPLYLSRTFTVNSGVGINLNRDNYSFDILNTESQWNPYYVGVDAGISVDFKRIKFGISMNNIQGKRNLDGLQTNSTSSFGFFGSYDLKIDSIGKYHFVPSVFIDYNTEGYFSAMSNLRFDIKNQTIGTGFNRSYISLFYQYQFKNNISIGVSLGRYRSILGNGMDGWNPMVRINYQFVKKNKHVSPDF